MASMPSTSSLDLLDILDKETRQATPTYAFMEYTVNDTNNESNTNTDIKTYIVTGGSGFLGGHIVEHLLHENHNVIVLDNKYPSTEILLQIEQASSSKFVLCDITRYKDVYRAFNIYKKNHEKDSDTDSHASSSSNSSTDTATNIPHIDCVFHCAALTDPWAHPSRYENVNIHGTQNIIRACQECNIDKLVYTSSTSVVLDGTDCQNGDESMKYVAKKNHLNAYSFSKHKSEEQVLLANASPCLNDSVLLKTCALRPHCIFGPRDTHFISQIVEKARHGKITHMIGEGHNITDFTYIDNVVYAHLLAAQCLNSNDEKQQASAAGQVYFITNGEPTLFWSFLGAMLKQLGCPAPTKYVSYNVAYAIALIMEFIYMIFGWMFGWRPILTRQMVCMMSCHHWFSHAKATRDLGYKPIVTLDEGIKKTVQYMQMMHRRRNQYQRVMTGSDSTESLRSLRSDISTVSSAPVRQRHPSLD